MSHAIYGAAGAAAICMLIASVRALLARYRRVLAEEATTRMMAELTEAEIAEQLADEPPPSGWRERVRHLIGDLIPLLIGLAIYLTYELAEAHLRSSFQSWQRHLAESLDSAAIVFVIYSVMIVRYRRASRRPSVKHQDPDVYLVLISRLAWIGGLTVLTAFLAYTTKHPLDWPLWDQIYAMAGYLLIAGATWFVASVMSV